MSADDTTTTSSSSYDPLDSPSPPTSPEDMASSPLEPPTAHLDARAALSPRTTSTSAVPPSTANMSTSSTPLGNINAARGNPPPRFSATSMNMNTDIAQKMKAFSLSRAGPPTPQASRGPPGTPQSPGPGMPGFPSNFKLPTQLSRPAPHVAIPSPAVPGGQGRSLAEKRGMKLPGGLPGQIAPPGGRQKPSMRLSDMGGGAQPNGDAAKQDPPKNETDFDKYKDILDPTTGSLKLGKATINAEGIKFASGKNFSISLDEVERMDELGKGNYGTVYKVRHTRPKFRRHGLGLAGNNPGRTATEDEFIVPPSPTRPLAANAETPTSATTAQAHGRGGSTGVVMAMKEMRLELDDAKFASIIMELDILHRCISPYIVDFYGAFFQVGAVYICMEWMDGGSIDKVYGDGIPEGVLRKITYNTTLGLKCLKEEHNIIHRDVKPTNILVNTRGQVKICDFGVSGNLVASFAKTNIGCQSYMAPERISGSGGGGSGGVGAAGAGDGAAGVGTYSVQSDIWSLGLTIIECALGRYPYPPETYDNIFSQLAAIVDGDPPDLPADTFSPAARDFVAGCLNKIPSLRLTYPMLLQHAWLAELAKPATITEEDEEEEEEAAAAAVATASGDAKAANEAADPAAVAGADGGFVDREVGEWLLGALERKRSGAMAKSAKPALHAAPLDAKR